MKIILNIVICLLLSNTSYGQKENTIYAINYVKYIILNGKKYPSEYELISDFNNGMSAYNDAKYSNTKDFKKTAAETKVIDSSNNRFTYTREGKDLYLIIKNYKTNSLYSNQEIANKFLVIKDSVNIFNWEIQTETKTILGYSCQLATTTDFRGRAYEAWFTTDLPVGGPWKYDGLPGMILEIKSDPSFIEIKATGIQTKKTPSDFAIENPFLDRDYYSWQEFRAIYKEKAIALLKYNALRDEGGGVIMPRFGIEHYIDADDTDFKDREAMDRLGIPY